MPISTSSAAGSLARRLSVIGSLGVGAVLLAICLVIAAVTTGGERRAAVAAAGSTAQSMAAFIDAFDKSSRQMAQRSHAGFRAGFPATFELGAGATLSAAGRPLNGQFDEVDRFQAATGGVATVFARDGDDFRRVTTSLRKENGDRAMGTLLGKAHPAHAKLTDGQAYSGRATLFGKPYMTHYEPVRDGQGAVVGALFIGFDLSSFQSEMLALLSATHLHDSGGLYVIDPRAKPADALFVFHPQATGKKVLEARPDAQPLFERLPQAEGGWLPDAPALLAATPDARWAVMRRSESTGWWVVAELSEAEALASHWRTVTLYGVLLGAAALALGGALFWAMRRWVARPLQQAVAAVETLAAGDLTHATHSSQQDEVGTLLRAVEGMRQRFLAMFTELRGAVHSIETASSEIATGNQDLSQRTEHTASNLQQAASSMEQLTGTVKNTADAATTANQLAGSASSTAARGGQAVSQVVSTMDEIHTSSKKIADIIGTIDGIAFQTNILALNAAVEAARAGEQGRGFAVVASEVRGLAQRSAEAAKEIKGLIGASVERVETGSRLVRDAGSTMGEIVASVQRVTDIIGEITVATGEQSQGIGQVNHSVVALDQMTQQNAALVEQSAAAAQSLREQAARLTQLMQGFRLQPA
ncbi:methyl-accepting chemotaxis protein [Aquincola tertiaricarbonis]|uniref:methyl-accepting chemotaxis protein n=1 Tax=Aquincola tertiaricarbonis TaxID=391953 RepID=UPI000614EDBB|nr:methyl-accepting chemotaxis protein [Aquincola tertiaricarbonis]